jgi:two-component system phosphate regulon sensor histidine kinase PhoR
VTVGVRGKLFGISVLLIATAVIASGFYLESRLRHSHEQRLEAELARQARTMRVAVLQAQADEPLDALADRLGHESDARVTIIALDGTVLGDSEVEASQIPAIENHGRRPEVRDALARGTGTARRFSTTVTHDLLYLAVTFPEQGPPRGVVRVAVPLAEVDDAVGQLRTLLLLAALVGLVIAIAMSGVTAELMSRQLRALVHQARGLIKSDAAEPTTSRRDELGRLAGSLSSLGDELGRSVGELATERDRLHTVLAQMGDAVLALDAEDRVVLLNDAAMRLLGLGDEARGEPLIEAVRVPDLQELVRQARGGAAASGECRLPGPRERVVMAHAAPLHTMSGCVVVLHDVTEVRRLERVRRDFVANVSHELRTPVSVISANAEALLAGALHDRERGPMFVDGVHRNAERLGRLINDLLDLSRIEAGQYAQKPRAMSVGDALRSALEAQRARADERSVEVRIDAPGDLCVRADPTGLAQILQNLLDNAIKYASTSIVLRARDCGDEVRIEVEDDGPGIEPHHRSRVFERFYRVDPGRSRELGGTGLGLSIVKHLVEAMDGSVGVEPAAERGSLFWVVLPRAEPPPSTASAEPRVDAR